MMHIFSYFAFNLRQCAQQKAGILVLVLINAIVMTSCATKSSSIIGEENIYTPHDKEIYKKIADLDSIFWKAYNDCDIETQGRLYSDSIEFYHDQAGLITSKQLILDATRANICGKIRRNLVKGSLEVYPIPGFGAVEIGKHTFQNTTDKGSAPSRPGNFVMIWKQHGNKWVISKVVSLH